MNTNELTHAASGSSAGVGSCFHGADIASNNSRDETGIDFLPANEYDIRGLHHRIGGFDHADQSACLYHPKGFADVSLGHERHLISVDLNPELPDSFTAPDENPSRQEVISRRAPVM